MNKIRVLHFTSVINRNDFIDIIIRNADKEKFLMMASSYRGYSNIEDTNYEADGIPNFILGIDHGWLGIFRGAWRLNRLLRHHQIDILHTHHFYESVIGGLACMLSGSTAHVIGRHYHNQFYITAKGLKLWFYLLTENIFNAKASAIVSPSTSIAQLLRQQGVKESKIKLIPYCFDFSAPRYAPIDPKKIQNIKDNLRWSNKFIVGNIGRHHIIKGQTFLIHAFKEIVSKVPTAMLVMIGDGPIHKELIEQANQLNLAQSILFLGWRKDAHELINCMDVIVHPTLQEAFPQLMIEVMALSKPLVITPVSGATDVIKDRQNGYLIPFKDGKSICELVIEIYHNKVEAGHIAKNGHDFVRENFTIQKIIPQFEELYFSLMK